MGLGDLVGHSVDERQQRPHMGFLRSVNSTALFALAVLPDGVVLGDRKVPPVDFRGQSGRLQDRARDDRDQIRIRQAVVTLPALAVPEREVLRVSLSVFVVRDLAIEAVTDVDERRDTAESRLVVDGVVPMANREHRVLLSRSEHRVTVVGERRTMDAVQRAGHSLLADRRHVSLIGGEKANAQVVLQKRVDAVERATRPSAGDGDGVVPHDDAQILRTEAVDRESHRAGPHRGTRSDIDVTVPLIDAAYDRESHTARLTEELLKLLRRVDLARDRVVRHHDAPAVQPGEVDAARSRSGRIGRVGDAAARDDNKERGRAPNRRQDLRTDHRGSLSRDFPFECTWSRSRLGMSTIVIAFALPVSSASEFFSSFFPAAPVSGFLLSDSRPFKLLGRASYLLCADFSS